MADSGYKYGWPELSFDTYQELPHFIVNKNGAIKYRDSKRRYESPWYIPETGSGYSIAGHTFKDYKFPEMKRMKSEYIKFCEQGENMNNQLNQCDEYEGTTEAIYIVCIPGSTECKVMVNMKEHKLDISYNMEYRLDKVKTIPKTKTIKVPEIYDLLKVKKETANGILRITIPVDEGYVFEVK